MDEHLDDETETLLKQQQEIDDQDFNLNVLEDDDGPILDKSLEVPVGGFTGLLRQSKKFISALFSTTSRWENFVLALGCLFTTVHGIIFPFVAIIFGCMTNLFIQQSSKNYANDSTTIVDSENFSDFSNQTTLTTSTLGKLTGVASGAQVVEAVDQLFGGVFDTLNNVVLKSFTENQVLTREEFIQTVSATGKIFCFLALLVFVASFLQVLCWEWIAVNQKYSLRESVFKRILWQNLAWFELHDVGELISNIFNEVARVREALGFQFSSILQCLAMFLASSALGFLISWRMALVFLSPVPVLLLRALTLGEKIGKAANEARALWSQADSIQVETLEKLDTVVAHGQQRKTITRFGTKLESAVEAFFQKFHLAAWGRAIIFLSIYGSYAGAFWYGCRLLLQDQITPGEIYAIFLAATMGTIALEGMLCSVTVVGNAYGAAVQLEEFGTGDTCGPEALIYTDTNAKIKRPLAEVKGEIEFESVRFAYRPNTGYGYKSEAKSDKIPQSTVFWDLSFKIPAGKMVALFGEPRAGKTTISNLILRLYDPWLGSIYLDGVDLRDWPVAELRSLIGHASQRPEIMPNATVDQNILAGRENVDESRLQAVKAMVDPAGELKSGSDPNSVSRLSTSAKHKINLARALLTCPPVVIIDDMFKELADEERYKITKNVYAERKRAGTTIVISNDIFDAPDDREMDLIYMLNDAKILPEEIGSFDDLYFRGEAEGTRTRFYEMYEDAKNKGRFRLTGMETEDEAGDCKDTSTSEGPETPPKEPEPGLLDLYEVSPSEKRLFALGLIGCLLSGAQMAVFAYYFVEIFATFKKTGTALNSDAIFWVGMLLLLGCIAAVGIWLRVLFMSAAALYLVLRIRTTAFASILRRPKAYFDPLVPKTTPATMGARVLFAVPSIRHVLEFSLPEGLSTAVALAIVSVIVSALVWQIGLILVTGVFLAFCLLAFCLYKSQGWAASTFHAVDAAAATGIMAGVDIIRLVQSYAMQNFYLRVYRDMVRPAVRRAHLQAVIFSLLYALCETLIFAFFGVSFLYGAELIEGGGTEPGSLFKTFFAMAICIVSFSQSVSLMPALARATGDLEWINGIVREESQFDSSMDALNEEGEDLTPDGPLEIEFVDVHFEYQTPGGGEPVKVLNGLSMSIPAGQGIALTGPRSPDSVSDADSDPFGGSTVLGLIQRFYDVKSGHLLINGKDIKTLNIGELRKCIGWVPQTPHFFEGSLAVNLAYGNEMLDAAGSKADEGLLKEVLVKVELNRDFEDLYAHRSEEHWRTLPRGTQVRIVLARAILRKPRLMLIDAPTNGMSPEEQETVERVIQHQICNGGHGWTPVLVSNVPTTFTIGTGRVETLQGGKTQKVICMSACI